MIRGPYTRRWIVIGLLGVVTAIAPAERSAADILPAWRRHKPDIMSGRITVQYVAETQEFTASGFPVLADLEDGESQARPVTGTIGYNLNLHIDNAGQLQGGNPAGPDLLLVGDIETDGYSGTLLTGGARQFEYQGSGIFHFIFDVTGGALASLYGPKAGVILDAAEVFGHDPDIFTASFHSGFWSSLSSVADTFRVTPEPGALVAWAFLGPVAVVFLLRAWRRRKAQVA